MRGILILIFLLILVSVSFAKIEFKNDIDSKVYKELEGKERVRVIVVVKEQVREENLYGVNALTKDEFKKKADFRNINAVTGEITKEGLVRLENDPNVEKIYYDYPVKLFLSQSVPLINAAIVHNIQVNNKNITGQGESICILDTGINYTHESFGSCTSQEFLEGNCMKVIGGYDFCGNSGSCDPSNYDLDPYDDHGHGTHVAGIAAAKGSVIGVAPDANLVIIKVLNATGEGFSSDIAQGIEYCINNSELYNISVISMSLGGGLYDSYCNDDYLASFINSAVAKNITVVVASGNDGNTTALSSPACVENSTSVGSTTKTDFISDFSNRASFLDLLAPGSDITSTFIDGLTAVSSGTSMATPHVAGAVALLQQYAKEELGHNLEVNEIEDTLNKTGILVNDTAGSGFFFSRIDVYGAILDLDNVAPAINISLSNDVLEYGQQNLTIVLDVSDTFLDYYNGNISYPNGNLLTEFNDDLDLITENLTEIGTYDIVVWANDTNGNENSLSKSFFVRDTSGPPTAILNSPNDNNFSADNLIFFNISIGSKYNVSTVSLYHNFTDWHSNQTLNLTDNAINETQIIFNGTFDDGIYIWGIESCDINDYCVFSENRTFFIDLNDPIVNLYSPENATTKTALPFNFNFNVSDYGISSCSLVIDNVVNETLSSGISLTSNTAFSDIYLEDGDHNWSVNCTDNVNRIGVSEEWLLTVACASEWSCEDWGSCQSDNTKTCSSWIDNNHCGKVYAESNTTSCTYSGGSDTTTSGGGDGTTGGTATEVISTVQTTGSTVSISGNAGDTKTFSFSQDSGLTELEIELGDSVSDAVVSVKKLDSRPAAVSTPNNVVYAYIQIDQTGITDDNIKEAILRFKVEKSWLSTYDESSVRLNRYEDSKWNELSTSEINEDNEYIYYEGKSPGFSVFSITVKEKTAVNETNKPPQITEIGLKREGIKEITGAVIDFARGTSGKISISIIVLIVIIILLLKKLGKFKIEKKKDERSYDINLSIW